MSTYDAIAADFQALLELVSVSVDTMADPVDEAVALCQAALLNEGKILCCGNGPGAAVAQLFSIGLIHRFEYDRPALPAFCLAADGATLSALTSGGGNDLFSRQIKAAGQPGDVLLAVAASDNNTSLIQAMRAAHERDMRVVLLSGGDCKDISSLITSEDVEIYVNSSSAPRIIEVQTVIVHCLCKLIDQALFGIYPS
ncbi:MAG: SIS domain-containing protein [Halieaceae bacterium]|jgi:phosphoheptose isomerase|nr:SIS domain-containing protein [Halieaceae bacterium]